MNFIFRITFFLLLFPCLSVSSQEFGIRFTPNIISKSKVINFSPARIVGDRRVSFDAGLDYTKMFPKSNFGVQFGAGIGIVDHNYNFSAPRNAFGMMTGEGQIAFADNFDNYLYNSISAQVVYRKSISRIQLEVITGFSKKIYHHNNEEEVYGYAFNRSTPYDFDDPNAGPPDYLITIPPIKNRLHLDIPLGIGIRRVFKDQSALTFRLVKNWNIEPVGEGKLFVRMYNTSYEGEFSPRSSYVGLDVRYSFSLKKRAVPLNEPRTLENKVKTIERATSRFKKSIFIEVLGNGGLASGNFDMRLKKNHNDGLGFRVGIGAGDYIGTDLNIADRNTTVPLNINYIFGARRSGFETGVGITPQFTFNNASDDKFTATGFVNMGYRYQALKEGPIFRIAFTPAYGASKQLTPWAGASLGYCFK
ncbi:hypothetical protein WG906_06070 [Pedobacter sp. P351]|uniref:hypothetical protein n=1 Tax=Pedobacter superstes TaxID=3133441 RepID=UPI0030A4A495